MIRRLVLSFGLAALGLVAAPANSQISGDMYGTMDMGSQTYMVQSSAMQSQLVYTQRMMAERYRSRAPSTGRSSSPIGGSATQRPASGASAAPSAGVDILYDPGVSARVRREFLAKFDPRVARGLDAAFSSDIRSRFAAMMGSFDIDTGNLCDVTAAYLASMWMAANQQATIPPSSWRGLKTQMQAALSHGDGPLRLPAERQVVAETMMYQAVATLVLNGYARQHGRDTAISEAIENSLKQSGFDLAALSMTTDGLLPRQ